MQMVKPIVFSCFFYKYFSIYQCHLPFVLCLYHWSLTDHKTQARASTAHPSSMWHSTTPNPLCFEAQTESNSDIAQTVKRTSEIDIIYFVYTYVYIYILYIYIIQECSISYVQNFQKCMRCLALFGGRETFENLAVRAQRSDRSPAAGEAISHQSCNNSWGQEPSRASFFFSDWEKMGERCGRKHMKTSKRFG